MNKKVFDLIPKEGNLAGKTYNYPLSPSMNKGSMTDVPKKKLAHASAKASAKAQHGKGKFNGSQKTNSGVRSD